MKEKLIRLHPYLFTLVSLLSLYMDARLIASPLQMVRPLLILWGILILLSLLLKWLIRDLDWIALTLTLFVFAFYYKERDFFRFGAVTILFLVGSWCTLLLLRKKTNTRTLSISLTLGGSLILLLHILGLVVALGSIPGSYYKDMAARSTDTQLITLDASTALKPDIYYIILDGYPRADVLNEIYHYDNTDFIDYLESLGFVVPDNSHSNYARTAASVSSTLDMQYWDSISPNMEGAMYWWLVKPVMDHSRLRSSLESIGYQSVSIATDWGITNNVTTDIYLKPFSAYLSDYEGYLLASTPLQLLYRPLQSLAPLADNNVHREFIRFSFSELKKMPELPGPKFIFSHIIVPHPPIVFNADGSPVDAKANFTFNNPDITFSAKEEYKQNYVEQVKFVNDQMRKVVDELLKKSIIPPVIIIQADHGSDLYVKFTDPVNSCMKERFSVFSAYYLPGRSPAAIPSNITPVNVFRIVLNEYFDAHLELLENHQYFMNGFYMFDTSDVTERVDDPCVIPR